ncbi:MAG: uracil-DNA glycosylase [Puniceicoccales bacterium]|nr:uracil-DNA glycosylase [Puniceicoccales bacterium]
MQKPETATLHTLLHLLRESLAEMKRDGVSCVPLLPSSLKSLHAAILPYTAAPVTPLPPNPPPATVATPTVATPATVATPTVATPAAATPAAATPAVATPAALPPPPQIILPDIADKSLRLAWLRERVLTCPTCNAHKHPGKKLVFGTGDPDAPIFFCGEAPGADEETLGEPFVGRAGELLTKIISAMGFTRDQVYIGNIMKWRPEMPTEYGNRAPTREEMDFCLPFLLAQIDIVQPRIIVALGRTAIEGLLGADANRSLGKIRGQWQEFQGIPLMPTYHPAYLLRNNTNNTKRTVWEDMLRVMERLQMPVSDRQRAYFLPAPRSPS